MTHIFREWDNNTSVVAFHDSLTKSFLNQDSFCHAPHGENRKKPTTQTRPEMKTEGTTKIKTKLERVKVNNTKARQDTRKSKRAKLFVMLMVD
jgi:hypothetical protein